MAPLTHGTFQRRGDAGQRIAQAACQACRVSGQIDVGPEWPTVDDFFDAAALADRCFHLSSAATDSSMLSGEVRTIGNSPRGADDDDRANSAIVVGEVVFKRGAV